MRIRATEVASKITQLYVSYLVFLTPKICIEYNNPSGLWAFCPLIEEVSTHSSFLLIAGRTAPSSSRYSPGGVNRAKLGPCPVDEGLAILSKSFIPRVFSKRTGESPLFIVSAVKWPKLADASVLLWNPRPVIITKPAEPLPLNPPNLLVLGRTEL